MEDWNDHMGHVLVLHATRPEVFGGEVGLMVEGKPTILELDPAGDPIAMDDWAGGQAQSFSGSVEDPQELESTPGVCLLGTTSQGRILTAPIRSITRDGLNYITLVQDGLHFKLGVPNEEWLDHCSKQEKMSKEEFLFVFLNSWGYH